VARHVAVRHQHRAAAVRRRPTDRAQKDEIGRFALLERPFGPIRKFAVRQVVLAAARDRLEAERQAQGFGDGLKDAEAFVHHFRPDAVARKADHVVGHASVLSCERRSVRVFGRPSPPPARARRGRESSSRKEISRRARRRRGASTACRRRGPSPVRRRGRSRPPSAVRRRAGGSESWPSFRPSPSPPWRRRRPSA
jgi:hypothetical protein